MLQYSEHPNARESARPVGLEFTGGSDIAVSISTSEVVYEDLRLKPFGIMGSGPSLLYHSRERCLAVLHDVWMI